jgi:hypothetical protein
MADTEPYYTKGLPDLTASVAPVDNRIEVQGGIVKRNGSTVRLAMSRKRIRIGCTEITIEAAQKIMAEHRARFGDAETEIVIQY